MIDVNAYLGSFAFRALPHRTASELLRLMDRKRIDRAVVSSAASITYRNSQSGNEELALAIEGHGDRFIGCAVLNPAYAGWRDDLRICHEQFGMKAVRLYPRWHNYKLSDAECLELVHAATERHMVVSIPIRVEDRRQQSWLVDIPDVLHEEIAALVKAVPGGRFMIHNGSGFVNSSLGRRDTTLPRNYVIDLTLLAVELANEVGQLLANLGQDRVVFGTGMPFHYPDPALVKLELLDVPESVKVKIRHETAAALFGV
jgi:uncharacterized protein